MRTQIDVRPPSFTSMLRNQPSFRLPGVRALNFDVGAKTFSGNSLVFGASNAAGAPILLMGQRRIFSVGCSYAASTTAENVRTPEDIDKEGLVYEKLVSGALPVPLRYLVGFIIVSKIVSMVAPTALAPEYLDKIWRCAYGLSYVWFLRRWVANVRQSSVGRRWEWIDSDLFSSTFMYHSAGVLFLILLMCFPNPFEALLVLLTVCFLGGAAAGFLSGSSRMSNSKNQQEVPVQIVSESIAPYHPYTLKVVVQVDPDDKILHIIKEIRNMLKSNTNLVLEDEKALPYRYLSRTTTSCQELTTGCNFTAELTIGCNVKAASYPEYSDVANDLAWQTLKIVENHGGSLGTL